MNYLASVRVYGQPTIWTLSHLEGQTDEERAIEVHKYLYDMGVKFYEVIHYAPMELHEIVIEDIYLN